MRSPGRRCRIVRDHAAKYPDPICARAGEPLKVGPKDSEFPGWCWCTATDGRSGWVPEALIEYRFGEGGVLTCDYDAKELTVRAGQEVVVEDVHAGWLRVRSEEGACGWIPAACTGSEGESSAG